jgi:hypothetical protein
MLEIGNGGNSGKHIDNNMGYKLKIENPCEQSWEKMLTTNGGKFCESCSKNVIDFTTMSDREIIQHLSITSGKLCGRLSDDQLNRVIKDNYTATTSSLFSKVAASFLFFSMAQHTTAFASAKTKPANEFRLPLTGEETEQKQIIEGDSTIAVRGTVLDSLTKETIPGASISISQPGFSITTSTNINGEFELKLPSELKNVVLTIKAVAYNTKEYTIDVTKPQELTCLIKLNSDLISVGRVGGISYRPPKWWQIGQQTRRAYRWTSYKLHNL